MSSSSGLLLLVTARQHRRALTVALCVIVLSAAFGCAAPSAEEELGPYRIVAGDKTLMASVIEPNADLVWDAVGVIMTLDEVVEKRPRTDEEWALVRNAAITIAESGNLLMLPERAHDQGDWIGWSLDMVDAGKLAMQATEARDVDALFDAGAEIYASCSGCHSVYWPESDFIVQGQDY